MELNDLLSANPELEQRFHTIKAFARSIRTSEYHVTHACNLRCRGCWFFEFGFDQVTGTDVKDLEAWRSFARRERERGITLALLIGGEPSLFPDRIQVFVEEMPYVWLSTNGLVPIPKEGFEDVAISITLFGGGPLDDDLRGIRPGGKTINGLFETALKNYKNDSRIFYIYALTRDSIPYMEDVVKRAGDNGNQVEFNYYGEYAGPVGIPRSNAMEERLLEKALSVQEMYPEVVLSHPYYIRTIIKGESHWGRWGYDVCPSISQDYPGNRNRLANGNPALPGFNSYAPDLKTINMCCTSGHCENCRDSAAVLSWLMISMQHFLDSEEHFKTWLELCEKFWSHFCWSPYHISKRFSHKIQEPQKMTLTQH